MMLISSAMTLTTTSSSISVNARRCLMMSSAGMPLNRSET